MLELVSVRELKTIDEFNEARMLEKQIWDADSAQLHYLVAARDHGALLLGAFYEQALIGFVYSYPAYKDGEAYLYSHQLGIKREYRERGIGELLKLKQRDIALERGFKKCIWTFDPLLARNAYLNFTKLRAFALKYTDNYYGELEDVFNNSLPSDRFTVQWDLEDDDYLRWDQKVEECIETAVELSAWYKGSLGLPVLQKFADKPLTEDAYFVYIPHHFQKIKLESPQLAEDWRLKTRELIQMLMQNNYTAVYLQPVNDYVARYVFVKRGQFVI
ncbi:MAG: GNAT family N-acetyltransferase [Lysinibacillus sp.]